MSSGLLFHLTANYDQLSVFWQNRFFDKGMKIPVLLFDGLSGIWDVLGWYIVKSGLYKETFIDEISYSSLVWYFYINNKKKFFLFFKIFIPIQRDTFKVILTSFWQFQYLLSQIWDQDD